MPELRIVLFDRGKFIGHLRGYDLKQQRQQREKFAFKPIRRRRNGMDRTFYAHISLNGEKQTVKEHLHGTAELCGKFASEFNAQDIGYMTGLMHDIGKYSEAFQKRLLEDGAKVDHSTAGAVECAKKRNNYSALCIAGHHAGLPDFGGRADTEGSSFHARMNVAKAGKIPDYSPWRTELEPIKQLSAPIKNSTGADFFTRMLYSCLTDADFLDTEKFMSGGCVERGGGESMEKLLEKLNSYTEKWGSPQNELNRQRQNIRASCERIGKTCGSEERLFTLTVPTGGGKTVASLAFALNYAAEKQKSRVIYVIPYTSIIEQTAGEFRKRLGSENVLEHHSGVVFGLSEEATPENMRLAKAAENWDKPVIVTTAVQFFESIYGNRSSKCRKVHSIANSVIIFDEAQMMPVPFMKPCISAIAQLVEYFNSTVVLCTATQPSLSKIFSQFTDRKPMELSPTDCENEDCFRRVTFTKDGKQEWTAIAESMRECGQALCIVNLRKSAQELFDLLSADNSEGCYHLSTYMVPAHRKEILEEIRDRLEKGKKCLVVSTSLIEAGVDVDFPTVYRETAGLDSILQSAGRCNREGKRPARESIVHIFESEKDVPKMFLLNKQMAERTLKKFEDISSREAIEFYFSQLYDMKGENALDVKQIMPLMEKLAFSQIAKEFKLIEDNTTTVYVSYRKGKEIIERLISGERSKELFREAGQYSIGLYDKQLQTLLNGGNLLCLSENYNKPEEKLYILNNMELYTESGILIRDDSGRAIFA